MNTKYYKSERENGFQMGVMITEKYGNIEIEIASDVPVTNIIFSNPLINLVTNTISISVIHSGQIYNTEYICFQEI